ncbi:MAG: lysine--tRNA ligase [Rhodospirillaceae bacterium]|nr:lysine--tRNA ligase [Rhodospirillaceae bacterium]OUT80914.1 MAG: lysine--tRNA ligase [Rhodospirillaceae bacterium TMED23]|tara:strand:- start:28399 stop:29988 length:1590 start_codon:yes stop_codon:yes gene_type:complete
MQISDSQKQLAFDSKSWPFQEARAILKRIKNKCPEKGYVLFETGYGPSGLPHIGTFGEVARTTMVRNAFKLLCDIPTKLIAFSDDMDGFRKVPDNVPQKELLNDYIGVPLTRVPDPFGEYNSFGEYNNARLKEFLDKFGFEYEFKSATETYQSGEFDDTLSLILRNYDRVKNIILPTLGEERRLTYSPFLPICARTGRVLQVPIVSYNVEMQTITYIDDKNDEITIPVTGGSCKMQWKVDWAMRWISFDVDYEMSGKDLIDSVKLSSAITKVLGFSPPQNFTYELFLDEEGRKISKSIGNGISMEEWMRYGPPNSLSQFMYQKPNQAKRLFFDVIPKNVDEYLQNLSSYYSQDEKEQLVNPCFHIFNANPPKENSLISYSILLNLVSVINSGDKAALWYFISRYVPGLTPEKAPILDQLTNYAINYFEDFVRPNKKYKQPNKIERLALDDLLQSLDGIPENSDSSYIQKQLYEVGKRHDFEDLKSWFKCLYQVLLGQSNGPRMGSFIVLYGIEETCELIRKVLSNKPLV